MKQFIAGIGVLIALATSAQAENIRLPLGKCETQMQSQTAVITVRAQNNIKYEVFMNGKRIGVHFPKYHMNVLSINYIDETVIKDPSNGLVTKIKVRRTTSFEIEKLKERGQEVYLQGTQHYVDKFGTDRAIGKTFICKKKSG